MYLLVRDWEAMTPMSVFTFACWSGMLLAQIATFSLPAAVVNWQVGSQSAMSRKGVGCLYVANQRLVGKVSVSVAMHRLTERYRFYYHIYRVGYMLW